jgi:hypothetical protein
MKKPKYRNERLERDCSTVETIRGQMRSATLQAAKAQILRRLGKISWAGPRIGSLSVGRRSGWTEVVSVLFGLDPDRDRERAQRVHDSHLARARWMTEHGYRDLLRAGTH